MSHEESYLPDRMTDNVHLKEIRERGARSFLARGFPGNRDESWRYTNVASLTSLPFARAQGAPRVSPLEVHPFHLDGTLELVMVNGALCKDLTRWHEWPEGLAVRRLEQATAGDGSTLGPYLGRLGHLDEHPFAALNTANIENGVLVQASGAATVHILHISVAEETPVISHPRVLIVADGPAQLDVVETFAVVGNGAPLFTNAVTELWLGPQARVAHFTIDRQELQAYHIGALFVHQLDNSRADLHSTILGSELCRRDLEVTLAGAGAECSLTGLYMASGRQRVDLHTLIDHVCPRCVSRELYHGIVGGHARAVFDGRIVVRQDARKTDARQTNHNILLSDDAEVDTHPVLEIFADDVKCSHGATIGQLDEEAVFYLRSRGLSEDEARGELVHAFATAVITPVENGTIRGLIERLIGNERGKS